MESGLHQLVNLKIRYKDFCISGNVNSPCNVEEEMGIPLKELIDKHAEVIGGWENLQATRWLIDAFIIKKICDTITMDFDTLIKKEWIRYSRYSCNQ